MQQRHMNRLMWIAI